ncbi:MAG: hypothetical protein R3321_13585 [Nitrososphaeraceae archaeon]|nr:hypothetical protein [Nitrososphaeraceae archaeon]
MLIKVTGNISDLRESVVWINYYFSYFKDDEDLKISGLVVTNNCYLENDEVGVIQNNLYTDVKFCSGYLPPMEIIDITGSSEIEATLIDGDVLEEDNYTYIGDLSLINSKDKTESDLTILSYIKEQKIIENTIESLLKGMEEYKSLLNEDWISNYLKFFLYDYPSFNKLEKYSHYIFLNKLGLVNSTDETISTYKLMSRYNPDEDLTKYSDKEYNIVTQLDKEPIHWKKLCSRYIPKALSTRGKGFGG